MSSFRLMSEATIPLVDSKSLLTLFGTRDQHLRKIRDSLGVSISGRNERIHIEGQDEAGAQATEVFEQLGKPDPYKPEAC